MPPGPSKKGPGAGRKLAARHTRVAAKQQQDQHDAAEETVKVEEERKKIKLEELKSEEKLAENEAAANGSVGGEEGAKDVFYEEDIGEELELEENEPDSENEEETSVEYYEKLIDDGQEVDEAEEEVEDDVIEEDDGDVVEEEEADMVDEDIEDGGEDVEEEGDHENIQEEHEDVGEEEEHHEVVKERRKRKEFEVFVGGLNKNATEDDLRKVFSEVGEITEIRLLMNPQTKKNKGFAFLRFATVEQAKRAVTDLKNAIVNGKQCGVAPSQDNDTLFLGNICKTWTKEHLKEKLKNYGIEKIEELMLVEDTTNEGMNRGFAFVEFSSRSDAMDAYKRLQKRDVVFGTDQSAKVAFADSFIEPDDEIMLQVRTVFVDGVPPAWDEGKVKEHVKKFGKIEKIELARNMPAAKRKDFGFVTFDTHEAAVACADSINNADLGEGDKVKVRARLSRPLQRGRGKHAARGDFRTIQHAALRESRTSLNHAPSRRFPVRAFRQSIGHRASVAGRVPKRPIGFRDRRPGPAISERARYPPPPKKSYDRKPRIPVYPKSSLKRDYDKRDELAPRSRAITEYGSRIPADRRPSYEDDYYRGRGNSDIPPRTLSHSAEKRPYIDEGYGRKLERPLPPYREGRIREYDSISGAKRSYSALDDAHPRYPDVSMRHTRARLEYGIGEGSSQFEDSYGERLKLSHMGHRSSRSSFSEHDSDGLYGGRQGISYSRGSASRSDFDGMLSSSRYRSYLSRDSDVGGSSYSVYSGRSLSGSGYLHGSGSGSYY